MINYEIKSAGQHDLNIMNVISHKKLKEHKDINQPSIPLERIRITRWFYSNKLRLMITRLRYLLLLDLVVLVFYPLIQKLFM